MHEERSAIIVGTVYRKGVAFAKKDSEQEIEIFTKMNVAVGING